jgi:hypothetical protein
MKKFTIFIVLLLTATFTWAQTADTQKVSMDAVAAYKKAEQDYANASMDLHRLNIRNQKRAIIQKAVTLTADQAKAFWPIYDKYEAALVKVNDIRYNMIKDYAANYETMTDEKAGELIAKATDFQDQRFALRKTYLNEAKTVLPAKLVARLYQLENQMDLLIDLDIASQVPLVK